MGAVGSLIGYLSVHQWGWVGFLVALPICLVVGALWGVTTAIWDESVRTQRDNDSS